MHFANTTQAQSANLLAALKSIVEYPLPYTEGPEAKEAVLIAFMDFARNTARQAVKAAS